MSSETDHPRQRTVAELLAAHGGEAAATGRRRRRREADDSETGGAPVEQTASVLSVREAGHRSAPPLPQQVSQPLPVPRWAPQPVGAPPAAQPVSQQVSQPAAPPVSPTAAAPAAPPAAFRSRPAEPVRERPTDVIPRVEEGRADPDDDGGPATMVGAAPAGAEAWHEARTRGQLGTSFDGGPSLPGAAPAGPPVDLDEEPDDHPDADQERFDDEFARHAEDDDELTSPPPRQRRLGRAAEAARGAAAPAWSAVIVQWIGGALGGAALWVAFRFLWRNLPVVALAASAIVTIGLVLVVRALMHNDDRRTTVFAVLVGLLLTVSPAILVLLGR